MDPRSFSSQEHIIVLVVLDTGLIKGYVLLEGTQYQLLPLPRPPLTCAGDFLLLYAAS